MEPKPLCHTCVGVINTADKQASLSATGHISRPSSHFKFVIIQRIVKFSLKLKATYPHPTGTVIANYELKKYKLRIIATKTEAVSKLLGLHLALRLSSSCHRRNPDRSCAIIILCNPKANSNFSRVLRIAISCKCSPINTS